MPAAHNSTPKALNILYLNTRSMVKHQLEIFNLLDTEAPDILLLTETWLTIESTPDIQVALPGNYYLLQTNRLPGKRGGGVAAAIKKPLLHRDLPP